MNGATKIVKETLDLVDKGVVELTKEQKWARNRLYRKGYITLDVATMTYKLNEQGKEKLQKYNKEK